VLVDETPQPLRTPPPGEQSRRLRARAAARRTLKGRALLAAGRLDQAILIAMRTRGHPPGAEWTSQALGTFGELGIGWSTLGLAGAAFSPSRRRRFLHAAAVPGLAVAINYAVKSLVGRQRPVIEGHPPLGPAPSKLSFPSAHSTSAVASATVLARIEPRAKLPLIALASLICAGRPYLGMHYPSDVLAGAALGYGIGRLFPLPAEPEERE
jgi:decaprenylphosphoryl-5-phosphoribose phosphatase